MKRLELGLTEVERQVRDERRRSRNCLIAIVVLWLIAGWLTYPN